MTRNTIEQYEEQTLMRLVAGGDKAAFASLFLQYSPQLEVNIQRITRDSDITSDVLQDTFIKIWLSREKLPEVRDARSYFNRIALNECFNQLSRLARENKLKDLAGFPRQTAHDALEELSFKETEAIIRDAVNGLPARRKEIYKLSRDKGLNSRQIATRLGLSPDYVRQALVAARNQIKTSLARAGKLFLLFSGFL